MQPLQPLLVAEERKPRPLQFSLASLFVLVTFAAVERGLFVNWPGVAIILALLAIPMFAYLRSTAVLSRACGTTSPAALSDIFVLLRSLVGFAVSVCWLAFVISLAALTSLGHEAFAWFAVITGGLAAIGTPLVVLLNQLPLRNEVTIVD